MPLTAQHLPRIGGQADGPIGLHAVATKRDGVVSFDTSGSRFGGLVINGKAQSGSPDPNTVIQIPNLGRVTLYQVTKVGGFVEVVMFHLEVLKDNPDFPLGTDLVLGYSRVGVR